MFLLVARRPWTGQQLVSDLAMVSRNGCRESQHSIKWLTSHQAIANQYSNSGRPFWDQKRILQKQLPTDHWTITNTTDRLMIPDFSATTPQSHDPDIYYSRQRYLKRSPNNHFRCCFHILNMSCISLLWECNFHVLPILLILLIALDFSNYVEPHKTFMTYFILNKDNHDIHWRYHDFLICG